MLLRWLIRLAVGLLERHLRYRVGCRKQHSYRPSLVASAEGLEANQLHRKWHQLSSPSLLKQMTFKHHLGKLSLVKMIFSTNEDCVHDHRFLLGGAHLKIGQSEIHHCYQLEWRGRHQRR